MEKDKFDIFIKCTKKAFEEITMELIDSEYKQSDKYLSDDDSKVVVIIGISGKNKGKISIEGSFNSISDFAMAMNNYEFFDDPKDMYFYIAEFANMFSGRAATYINNEFQEREAWLAPPAIFSGSKLEMITPKIRSENIFYQGKQGSFLLGIGFEEGKN